MGCFLLLICNIKSILYPKMKKHVLLPLFLLFVSQATWAAITKQTINKTLDSTVTSYQLDINGDQAFDATFNYFSNGAFTITTRVGNGNAFMLATETISGSNSRPSKVANNQTFTNLSNWKSNGIFIHSPGLGYTGFAGTGNQYIAGRMNLIGGTDYFYFWILVNVNASGSQLTILKTAMESEPNMALSTENEGQSNVGYKLLSKTKVFTLFPQPASSSVEVITDEKIEAYKIFNINGQLILSRPMPTTNVIDVTNIAKDVYLLQLLNNNEIIHIQKIIIDK